MVSGRGRTSRMQMARSTWIWSGSWGPAIWDTHPAVIESVTHAAAHRLSFGTKPGRGLLAEIVVARRRG